MQFSVHYTIPSCYIRNSGLSSIGFGLSSIGFRSRLIDAEVTIQISRTFLRLIQHLRLSYLRARRKRCTWRLYTVRGTWGFVGLPCFGGLFHCSIAISAFQQFGCVCKIMKNRRFSFGSSLTAQGLGMTHEFKFTVCWR